MAWVSLGVSLPLLATIAVLAALGALADAVSDLVLFPLRYYPGGLSNSSLLSTSVSEVTIRSTEAETTEGWAFRGTRFLSMLLPVATTLTAVAGAIRWRRRDDWLRLVQCALPLLFLSLGRFDWIHTSVWAPFFLLLLAESTLSAPPRWPIRLFAGWVLLLLAFSFVLWGNLWLHAPPRLTNVVEVDSWWSQHGPAGLVQELPDSAKRPPVACLPFGSMMYLYYEPDRPPLDWLMPPSRKWNAPWEFQVLADFLSDRKIPYVLISWPWAKQFLAQPSPIQEVLAGDYAAFARTAWGLLLKRNDHEARPKPPPPDGNASANR
jgi:hypothetical protein